MNKQDLIETMASSAGISKASAERALNAFTAAVTDELREGKEVALIGFGAWSRSTRGARSGRNPQTGEVMQIPASIGVKFRVGKKLKDAVNVAT